MIVDYSNEEEAISGSHSSHESGVAPSEAPLQTAGERLTDSSDAVMYDAVWVVIPAFNESSRIQSVSKDLRAHGRWQVVVVDDGSSDGTARQAAEEGVWVLQHIVNRGQGAALQTGIDFALSQDARVVVTFDADGQHCGEDVPKMLAPIFAGECDVTLGSRFLGRAENVPRFRRFLLKVAVLLSRLTSGLSLTDTHNGLRAMTSEAAKQLRMSEDGMAHASEFLDRLAVSKLAWKEVPVTIRYSAGTLAKGQRNSAAFKILFRILISKVIR